MSAFHPPVQSHGDTNQGTIIESMVLNLQEKTDNLLQLETKAKSQDIDNLRPGPGRSVTFYLSGNGRYRVSIEDKDNGGNVAVGKIEGTLVYTSVGGECEGKDTRCDYFKYSGKTFTISQRPGDRSTPYVIVRLNIIEGVGNFRVTVSR